MMRSPGVLVLVSVVVAGCSSGPESGWIATSSALESYGVHSLRVASDGNAQVVLLRGPVQESVGQLRLSQDDQTTTFALQLGADRWSQSVVAARHESTFTLNGREVALADSTRFVEAARLIGAEAHLTLPGPQPVGEPVSAGQPVPAGQPVSSDALLATCCGTALPPVTAQGLAFYWEPAAPALACQRARTVADVRCKALTLGLGVPGGLACCNTPPEGTCLKCENLGLTWWCFTNGYVEYVCK